MQRAIKILLYSILALKITGINYIPAQKLSCLRRIMYPAPEERNIYSAISSVFQNYPLEKIKLIALDYDGTLTKNGAVPKEIISLLQKLNNNGFEIAIITLASKKTISKGLLSKLPPTFNKKKLHIYTRGGLLKTTFNKGKTVAQLQKNLGLNPENTLIIGDRFGLLGQDRPLLPYGKLVFNVGKHVESNNLINLESKNSQATQLILKTFLEIVSAAP